MEKTTTPNTNARNTPEVAMSKTTRNTTRTENAYRLFEQAVAIYDEWMTPRTHRRLSRIVRKLQDLGYDFDDITDAIRDAAFANAR